MALKVLLLRKELDGKEKALEAMRARGEEFNRREKELAAAIDEVETDEQRSAVEEMVNAFEAERQSHTDALAALEAEVEAIRAEMEAEEAKQNTEPEEKPAERKAEEMNRAETVNGGTMRERLAQMVQREDVRAYLNEVRAAMREKRAITNVGLTIPVVMLGLLRENIIDYSKLYRHVTVRRVGGTARQLIMGAVPEAVWTDCCANLNELTLGFYDLEMDCFKVGGFFAVCNANLEDSDIDLAAELMTALGQAIGLALDKAIAYGRNGTTTQKMPQGIVSRLVQTEAPTGYPATARPWENLSASNVITIPSAATGIALYQALATASGAAKGKYSHGEKVWVMNETTYTALVTNAMSIDAGGAIVSGVNGNMPVIGGIIEVLSFIPDNVIIGGYFDLYTLAERAGEQFASSEHVRFLQDQTVFKGTARYDGAPAIAEAFVAIGINGTTPDAASVTFPTDTANDPETIWLPATATVSVGAKIALSPVITPKGVATTLTWASATEAKATVSSSGEVTGVATGTSVITVTTDNGLTAKCTVTVTSA